MKSDATLVDVECLTASLDQVAGGELLTALAHLASQEPTLAGFIREKLSAMAGELALSGAPQPVVSGVHADALLVVLASLQALRLGHYRLWQDCVPAERLPAPDLPEKTERKRAPRRRGRHPGNDGTQETTA